MPHKNIRFTKHAVQRKLERNITDEQIMRTLQNPNYTISQAGKRVAVRHFAEKIITVLYIETETYIKVITVY
jgi:hypothetical protein